MMNFLVGARNIYVPLKLLSPYTRIVLIHLHTIIFGHLVRPSYVLCQLQGKNVTLPQNGQSSHIISSISAITEELLSSNGPTISNLHVYILHMELGGVDVLRGRVK